MDNILVLVAIAAPIALGLVEAVKRVMLPSSVNESRVAPLASLIFGVLVCLLLDAAAIQSATFWESVLAGTITGLTASGLYSGTKNLLE